MYLFRGMWEIEKMSDSEVPQYIKSITADLGFDIVALYQQVQSHNESLKSKDYKQVLQILQVKFGQDYGAGKLDLIQAVSVAFSILQLSYTLNDYESQIVTLSNLGLIFQNARAYDVALIFAAEGIPIAYKHNLLEAKLKALKIISLVYTNTQQTEKRIEVMEEVAEIHGKLGQMDKKAEIEGLIKHSREFMAIFDK